MPGIMFALPFSGEERVKIVSASATEDTRGFETACFHLEYSQYVGVLCCCGYSCVYSEIWADTASFCRCCYHGCCCCAACCWSCGCGYTAPATAMPAATALLLVLLLFLLLCCCCCCCYRFRVRDKPSLLYKRRWQ